MVFLVENICHLKRGEEIPEKCTLLGSQLEDLCLAFIQYLAVKFDFFQTQIYPREKKNSTTAR